MGSGPEGSASSRTRTKETSIRGGNNKDDTFNGDGEAATAIDRNNGHSAKEVDVECTEGIYIGTELGRS